MQAISCQCSSVAATHLQSWSHIAQYQCLWHLYDTYLHLAGSIWCHIPGHNVFCSVQSLWDSGYGWQYFRCFLCLIQRTHFASCMSTLYHSPHLLLFVLGQPCRGIWYAQPWIVPHITPVHTICPAAPGEFLLLSFTTSGGMFLVAFSKLKALLPDFSSIPTS